MCWQIWDTELSEEMSISIFFNQCHNEEFSCYICFINGFGRFLFNKAMLTFLMDILQIHIKIPELYGHIFTDTILSLSFKTQSCLTCFHSPELFLHVLSSFFSIFLISNHDDNRGQPLNSL